MMKFLAIAACVLLTVAGCKQRTEDPLRPEVPAGGESFCVEIFNEKNQFDAVLRLYGFRPRY